MLSINMSDVVNVITSIKTYLIAAGAIILAAVIIQIAVSRMAKPGRRLIRGTAFIAAVSGIAVFVNMICTGPMSTMLDLISGSGTISKETSEDAAKLAVKIAEEGTILLENKDDILPLAEGSKLNVFGWASTNPMLGGGGSGALNEAFPAVSLLESLADAGIETNTGLSKFYADYKADRPIVGMWAQDWTLPEPNVNAYSADLMAKAKAFSDTAMIVISRPGGEGADLPADVQAIIDGTYQDGTTYTAASYDDTLNEGNDWNAGDHYLQLNNREKELVGLVCSSFDKVIVVYNGSNAFEFGFVKEHPQIKGLIWAAPGGHVGMTALGEIVAGKVNPSARTADTLVYDLKQAPWWNNFGDFNYTNMNEFAYTSVGFTGTETTSIPSFVNYTEGIYVGYRFYETAAAEGLIKYDDVVQYPFGYGLSYTTFSQRMSNLTDNGDSLSFSVRVTNTGSTAGKEVIQVYSNPPYTNGGIEKSSANLVQFAKTGMIEPGASESLKITVSKEELMSYDDKNAKGYVLEAGDYVISIGSDSHNVLDSRVFTIAETQVCNGENKRASDLVTASNVFDYAAGDVTYLSRADGFANYAEATAAPASFEMPAEAKASFYNISNYLTAEATAADEDPDAAPVTTGAAGGLTLSDMRGLDKEDPKWDRLMDEMSLDDMNALISLGGYQTNSVDSIGKIRTNDCDGPASINNNFTGVGSIGFPVGVVIASSWNKDLAYDFGDSIGMMADEMDVSGWYAPAMNNHPVLSAYIASNAVMGSQDNGVYAYMKHFALNDQEGNRCDMLCTWCPEQAIREIYLKPFERCVKDAGCLAVMSSFNYIGNRWAGGSSSLCKTVLRDEWGFKGFVETDYFGVYGYMSADQAIRNGTDLMLVNYPTATNDVRFRDTAGAQQAMRTAAKNILYVVANSRQYDPANVVTGIPKWKLILYAADAVLGLLLFMLFVKIVGNFRKRRKGWMD